MAKERRDFFAHVLTPKDRSICKFYRGLLSRCCRKRFWRLIICLQPREIFGHINSDRIINVRQEMAKERVLTPCNKRTGVRCSTNGVSRLDLLEVIALSRYHMPHTAAGIR